MIETSWTEPIPRADLPSKWEKEADIVIIGAGGAGLVAAARATVEGASVIVLEKMDDVGGASQHATLAFGIGTKVQKRAGMELDENQILTMVLAMNNYRPDVKVLRQLIHKGSETIDWMEDLGMDWELALWDIPGYLKKGTFQRRWLCPQRDITDFMHDIAKKKGADFLLSTRAVALVKEGNRIVGVKAEREGKLLYVKAKKALILAAGGMSQNRDMLSKYIPSAIERCGSSYDMPFNTGECIRMGLGVGADLAGYNSFSVFEGGLPYYEEGKGSWDIYLYRGDIQLARQAWLWVNKACERFCNEYAPGLGYVTAAIAGTSQPGHEYYVIFDSNYEKDIAKFKLPFCKDPLRPDMPGMAEWDEVHWNCPKDWRVAVKAAIDKGMIKVADTVEGLAEELGLDPRKLKKTFETYNGYCAKGEDPEYGKGKEYLIPVKDPPFYGMRSKAQLITTHCGLRVNEKMQVLDKNFDVIPGLCATYHTAGGDLGENIIGLGPLGEVNLAYTSGYIAAENAVV